MKCIHCGADIPDGANYCAVCAKPQKAMEELDEKKEVVSKKKNARCIVMTESSKKRTVLGLISLIIGIVSLVGSCIFIGFLGIVGAILGIISLVKREPSKGKAIAGISCSVIAFVISICVVVAVIDDPSFESTYQTENSIKKDAETSEAVVTPEPTNTPVPTLSPAEIKQKIENGLKNGDKKTIAEYDEKKTSQVAIEILKSLQFKSSKDYDIVANIAKVMVSNYPKGVGHKRYKALMAYYKDYQDVSASLKNEVYDGIEEKWEEAEAEYDQIVSKKLHVIKDFNADSSTWEKILDAISDGGNEYEHAYYAVGLKENALFGWLDNDDDEYVIYTVDAFPKAGNYDLELIPTGETATVTESRGFEKEIPTYTLRSDEDETEYAELEELVQSYDSLKWECKEYKKSMRKICDKIIKETE